MNQETESCKSRWEELQKEVREAIARFENDCPNSVETGHLRKRVEQFCQSDTPENDTEVFERRAYFTTILSQISLARRELSGWR